MTSQVIETLQAPMLGPAPAVLHRPSKTQWLRSAGDYVVTVTSGNGCTATITAVVSEDRTAPGATTGDDVIDCNNPTATLTANSQTNGVKLRMDWPQWLFLHGKRPNRLDFRHLHRVRHRCQWLHKYRNR